MLRAALVAVSTGLLVAVAMARGAAPRTASILSLAAFMLMASAMALRPQLLGIALFAVLLLLVAVRDRHPRAYLLAPLVIIAWANIHGSFVLGPLVLGYAWAEDMLARRPGATRSLIVFLAGTLATLLNPYGIGVWAYAVGIGANPGVTQMVTEWQRTSPLRMPGALLYPAAIAAFVLLVRGRSRVSLADWGLAIVLTLMAVWAERGVAWWAMGMVYLLGGVLAERRPVDRGRGGGIRPPPAAQQHAGRARPRKPPQRCDRDAAGRADHRRAAVVAPGRPAHRSRRPPLVCPSGLAAAVRDRATPGARVVAPQNWGSWFEWAAPQALYFADSRFEFFPVAVWADYRAIESGGDAAAAVAGPLGGGGRDGARRLDRPGWLGPRLRGRARRHLRPFGGRGMIRWRLVGRALGNVVPPVVFLMVSLLIIGAVIQGGGAGIDARIYYRGSAAWLAGTSPWEAYVGRAVEPAHYAALPTTVVLLAPFTFLPEDAFVALSMVAGTLAAVYTVRTLPPAVVVPAVPAAGCRRALREPRRASSSRCSSAAAPRSKPSPPC